LFVPMSNLGAMICTLFSLLSTPFIFRDLQVYVLPPLHFSQKRFIFQYFVVLRCGFNTSKCHPFPSFAALVSHMRCKQNGFLMGTQIWHELNLCEIEVVFWVLSPIGSQCYFFLTCCWSHHVNWANMNFRCHVCPTLQITLIVKLILIR
jgi:hypothetical protein